MICRETSFCVRKDVITCLLCSSVSFTPIFVWLIFAIFYLRLKTIGTLLQNRTVFQLDLYCSFPKIFKCPYQPNENKCELDTWTQQTLVHTLSNRRTSSWEILLLGKTLSHEYLNNRNWIMTDRVATLPTQYKA